MDDFMDYDSKLDHYIEIGAISIEGVDPDGELILSVTDKARELAPDLWQAHIEYVDKQLIDLYEKGLIEVEYNENLEATFKLSPTAVEDIKDKGIWLVDEKDE
jgi:hypothetical protein